MSRKSHRVFLCVCVCVCVLRWVQGPLATSSCTRSRHGQGQEDAGAGNHQLQTPSHTRDRTSKTKHTNPQTHTPAETQRLMVLSLSLSLCVCVCVCVSIVQWRHLTPKGSRWRSCCWGKVPTFTRRIKSECCSHTWDDHYLHMDATNVMTFQLIPVLLDWNFICNGSANPPSPFPLQFHDSSPCGGGASS